MGNLFNRPPAPACPLTLDEIVEKRLYGFYSPSCGACGKAVAGHPRREAPAPAVGPIPQGGLAASVTAAIEASLLLRMELPEPDELPPSKKAKAGKATPPRMMTVRGSAVPVTARRTITSLHGTVNVGQAVTLITSRGISLPATVELQVFNAELVDIAVVVLDGLATFPTFLPWCRTPVTLVQSIVVAGLRYTGVLDDIDPYARFSSVDLIERREGSALFHSSYSFDGCSGVGIVLAIMGDTVQVVGVHVGSHDDTSLPPPPDKKKRSRANLEVSITSAIHGHKSYSLVCEVCRVPAVVQLLTANP